MQRGAINRWGGGYTRYDSVEVIRSNTLGHCIGMLLWVFTQSAGTQGCFRRFLSLLNNWGFQSNFRNCGLVAAVFCAWLWNWLIQGKVVVCGVVRGLYTQGSLWMHMRAINRWGVGLVRSHKQDHCMGVLLWVSGQSAGTKGCFIRFLSLPNNLGWLLCCIIKQTAIYSCVVSYPKNLRSWLT